MYTFTTSSGSSLAKAHTHTTQSLFLSHTINSYSLWNTYNTAPNSTLPHEPNKSHTTPLKPLNIGSMLQGQQLKMSTSIIIPPSLHHHATPTIQSPLIMPSRLQTWQGCNITLLHLTPSSFLLCAYLSILFPCYYCPCASLYNTTD